MEKGRIPLLIMKDVCMAQIRGDGHREQSDGSLFHHNSEILGRGSLTDREILRARIASAPDYRVQTLLATELRFEARRDLFDRARQAAAMVGSDFPVLTSEQRLEYFSSEKFTDWVAFERKLGNRVMWLTDLDKAKAAGDSFVYFFEWRIRNEAFSADQGVQLKRLLAAHAGSDTTHIEELSPVQAARMVFESWKHAETRTGSGISFLDFWAKGFWPSQVGLICSPQIVPE